jgi:hypothetical protein
MNAVAKKMKKRIRTGKSSDRKKRRPSLPKTRLKWFDRPLSRSGREVVEGLNDSLGRDFTQTMRYVEDLYDSLTQQEFIDAMTDGGMTEHEAYTLWHSPPMG